MSDVLWWFLQPSGLVLVLLALVWLLLVFRSRGGLLLVTLLVAGWATVVLLPVTHWIAAPLEARHPPPDSLPAEVDGIIVLGGAVDWRVSVARRQLNLGASAERVMAGAALARRYPDATLVFTGVGAEALAADFGGSPGPRSLIFGAAFEGRDPIFLSASASTYEDALLAVEQLPRRPGETWLLVTSAWHMPRAWATFRTLGWTTVPYPVDFVTGGEDVPPRTIGAAGERLADLDRVVREWGALWIYRRTGRIDEGVWRGDDGPTTPAPRIRDAVRREPVGPRAGPP